MLHKKCQNTQTINFHTSIHWYCIFTATEVRPQITMFITEIICTSLICTAYYTQSNAGQCNIYSRIYFSIQHYLLPIMDLDPHSQKHLSHDLINDISYKNASAVSSVVQHPLLWCHLLSKVKIAHSPKSIWSVKKWTTKWQQQLQWGTLLPSWIILAN